MVPQESPTEETTEDDKPSPPCEESRENIRQDSGEQFDPFSMDGDNSAWSDPQAFYDHPPARLAPSAVPAPVWNVEQEREGEREQEREQEVQAEEERGKQHRENSLESEHNFDDDCTGGSTYMDTSQFLRTNVPSTSGLVMEQYSTPEEVLGLQEGEEDRNTTPTGYHLGNEGSGDCVPYEYPSALTKFPASRDGPARREMVDGGHDIRAPSTGQSRSHLYMYMYCIYI